jgi:hypothetical protein
LVRWLFEETHGRPSAGTEFTIFGDFGVSTKNTDTDYRNGNVVHVEATLQQYLPLS